MTPTLEAALRRAIRESGLSAYQLSKQSGVPQPTLSRFINGADMKLETASKIAAVLGLVLKPEGK